MTPIVRPSLTSGDARKSTAIAPTALNSPASTPFMISEPSAVELPSGAQDVGGQAAGERLVDGSQLRGVRPVGVDGVDVEREVDLLPLCVVQGDVEVLGVDEPGEDLVDAAVELLHLAGRAGQLGDAIQGRLGPRRVGLARELCLELGDALRV